ncbi:MAG: Ldh family oxidoreductase [Lewinellaceae bacterium]|nr:Ldh family oxidoreductase [Lewinellaceae bacterium]
MKQEPQTGNRYRHSDLTGLAASLLSKAGLDDACSRVVADTLLEAELLGHRTHGLALLQVYLQEIESGNMSKSGMPQTVNDLGATVTWDGNYLPGPWLMQQAIQLATERLREHAVVTVVIRKSHHIACLAAYLEATARKGFLILLSCSDPMNKTVAPYGGVEPVYSPNPIAAGIPGEGDPILFDISTSTTANGLVVQRHNEGRPLPHPWLMDRQGHVTDDPAAFFDDPPASILPLGGLDTGYKGFALGILVEALTNGLSGYGRKDEPARWGASVFLQLIDPEAFGGTDHFKKEMSGLMRACMAAEAMPGGPPVRLPGQKALALKKEQSEHGILLQEGIVLALTGSASRYGLEMPEKTTAA